MQGVSHRALWVILGVQGGSHVIPRPSPPGKLEAGATRGAGEVALGGPLPAASLITISPQRCSPCPYPVVRHSGIVKRSPGGSGSVQCDSPQAPLTNHGPLNDVRDQVWPVHPSPDSWPGVDGRKLSSRAQEMGEEGARQAGVLSAHPPPTCPQRSEQACATFPGLSFPSLKQESWSFCFSSCKSLFPPREPSCVSQ